MHLNISELKNELAAPIKSIRIFAVEKCFKLEPSLELIKILEERLKVEDDEECQILLNHCVEYLKSQSNNKNYTFCDLSIQDDIVHRFLNLSISEKIKNIKTLKNSSKGNIKYIFSILEREENPFVLSEIVRNFAYNFNKDQLQLLIDLFKKHNFLSVRLAILEVLSNIYPESIKKEIPKLLISEDPKLRLLAIKTLSKFDLSSALEYLEEYLFNSDINYRKLALQSLILFPFELVNKLLVNYISFESDISQLRLAIDILLSNPEPNVIYKIYELAENTLEKEKSELLRSSCNELIEIIRKSNILENKFEEFYHSINLWFCKRKVYKCINSFYKKFLDDYENFSLEEFCNELAKIENSRNIILEVVKIWTINKEFKDILFNVCNLLTDNLANNDNEKSNIKFIEKSLIEQQPKGKLSENQNIRINNKEKETLSSIKDIWTNLSLTQKVRLIALSKPNEILENKNFFHEVMISDNEHKEVKAAILKSFKKCNIGLYKDLAINFLNSSVPQLVAAAIEYLEEFDFDTLTIHIGKLLNSESQSIRVLALKVLLKIDKFSALSAFKAMLKSKLAFEQSVAVGCAVYFDFNIIRDSLYTFLLQNPDYKLFEGVIFLFQANPELENLYYLYKLEKKFSSDTNKLELIKKVKINTYNMLCETLIIKDKSLENLEADFEKKFLEESKKQKSSKEVDLLQDIKETNYKKLTNFGFQINYINWTEYWKKTKILYLFAILLMLSIQLYYNYYLDKSTEEQVQKSKSVPLLAIPVYVIGTLIKLDKVNMVWIFTDENYKNYSLKFNNPNFYLPYENTKVKLRILPLRLDENNVIHGIILEMQKL